MCNFTGEKSPHGKSESNVSSRSTVKFSRLAVFESPIIGVLWCRMKCEDVLSQQTCQSADVVPTHEHINAPSRCLRCNYMFNNVNDQGVLEKNLAVRAVWARWSVVIYECSVTKPEAIISCEIPGEGWHYHLAEMLYISIPIAYAALVWPFHIRIACANTKANITKTKNLLSTVNNIWWSH